MPNEGLAFERLVHIMNELREKCPWDKKQTIHTLRSMTIEETYELAEGIIDEDWENIKEELGDLLLHIIFYARIGEELFKFTLNEVVEGICSKLIRRHPHIYGKVIANNEEDVKKNWEAIKRKEGKISIFNGLPVSLPSIVKAVRIQEKAKQVGFEWDNKEDVWRKVEEEIAELQDAVEKNNKKNIEEEFGDVLFSLINYARFLRLDPETALEKINKKFVKRFVKMEEKARANGRKLEDLTLEEMDEIWNHIKKEN